MTICSLDELLFLFKSITITPSAIQSQGWTFSTWIWKALAMGNPEIKQEISKWGWWLNLCLIRSTPILSGSSQPICPVTTEPNQDRGHVQFSSVAQSCPTLCDPMDRSTAGLPVHHQLPEFTQTQCPSSQRCHPAISSSVVPFSSCPQSLPASESFPMSQLFA